MHPRVLRRATILASTLALVVSAAAFADQVPADGDLVTPGRQSLVELGAVAPGATVSTTVGFELLCANGSHVDPGTVVTVSLLGATLPADGSVSIPSDATIGPVPATWPADGVSCPADLVPLPANAPMDVTLVAPTTPADGYLYTLTFLRSPSDGISGVSSVSFSLDVVGDLPPSVSVPGAIVVEGDTLGGWASAWTATASDPEDGPLTPTCNPAAGTVLPLGLTTVTCSATDSFGHTASASFDVTVFDGTAPALAGVPGDLAVTTADPAGASVSWPAPTATDVVDGDRPVTCAPASGSTFAVGTTTVTCSASDSSGNTASATFDVSVTLDVPTRITVRWGEPVGTATQFVANAGRNLPLKADVAVDGARVARSGATPHVVLDRLDACGGTPTDRLDAGAMSWDGNRWTLNLDTAPLGGGCWRVSVAAQGAEGGTFELKLTGSSATAAKAPKSATRGG